MNQNYVVIEDERASMGGQINRHEHAFHAQYYALSEEQKQKLREYANLIQNKARQRAPNYPTAQAIHLFKWIHMLCENFQTIVSKLDQLINDLQQADISETVNTSNNNLCVQENNSQAISTSKSVEIKKVETEKAETVDSKTV